MHLSKAQLQAPQQWAQAEIRLPRFDLEAVTRHTAQSPTWVHFGAGNIFRAFPAALCQTLLEAGAMQSGIVVAEGYDNEIIEKIYAPRDNLGLLVTLRANGSIEKTVIASVCESLAIGGTRSEDFQRLQQIFCAPSLQMVSFTITEKGYSLARGDGTLLLEVQNDLMAGPLAAESYIGKLTALCYARYQAGGHPFALVSMDNCSHNGDKLRGAIMAFAEAWEKAGLCDPGFCAWLQDPQRVSFPWTMIDKITPRPDEGVQNMLRECGFDDAESITTQKHTFIAPFVNAEEAQYLVIEDHFPGGRPPLEQAGVLFADRETVDKVEKMKVCTCLNPLHTALAVFGCLLGYDKISKEVEDPDLSKLVHMIGYQEGLPVVVNPGVLDPKQFLDDVLQVRLPNPFMPDTPQRIATDTSQKLSIRFGETIKTYLRSPEYSVDALRGIPLVLAGWCRYLLGIDDEGSAFQVSPDPMYPALRKRLSGISLGNCGNVHAALEPILSDSSIFGVNLYEAGLGQRVEQLFLRMVERPGAVRATLAQTVDNSSGNVI